MSWQSSVLNAIRDLCYRKDICKFSRSMLLEELETIIKETKTKGKTPENSVSLYLQHLRDQGYIEFVDNNGNYRLI